GQADLALTAYLCLATLAVWRWQSSSDWRWLMLVGAFSAAAALTKFEGLPRICLLAVALLVEFAIAPRTSRVRQLISALLSLIAPALAAWLLWTGFQLTHAIPSNAEHVGSFQPLALGGVLLALLGVFAGVRTGGGLGVAAAAWLVAANKLVDPPQRLLVLAVAAQALGTLFAFLVSATSPETEVLTSA